MKRKGFTLIAGMIVLALLGSALAQKDKKWTEWNKNDVQKMLTDSPWARVQKDTDTTEQMYSPTTQPGVNGARATSNDDTRLTQGATNQATSITYVVRFFSARPIREALIRSMELTAKQPPPPEQVTKMHAFAEGKAQDSIIVTVSYTGTDQRFTNQVMQALNSAVIGTLKNNTYLQRSDGKQLFLEEYYPPGKDNFGARFVFLRMPDDKLFINADSKEIRFYTELSSSIKVDRRFKVADMMYEGQLEY